MNHQLQEDIAESEPYLEKSSGRRTRIEKSNKARSKRANRKAKAEREYMDGFGGNYDE